jgi:L-asparaginase
MTEQNQLPRVRIIATGGTIAGKGASSTQMIGYKAGVMSVEEMVAGLPELAGCARLTAEQVSSVPGNEMTDAIVLQTARRVQAAVDSPDVDGVVVTQGTDCIEETAYFLNLTINSAKPIVVAGAMRPTNVISSDAQMNLLNAVQLAGSKDAGGRGVLVCLNDQINAARDVTKTNTNSLETFHSPDFGLLGYMIMGKPHFYRAVLRRHTVQSEFSINDIDSLPPVSIIYGHVKDSERYFIDAAVAAGNKGIIWAGVGNGNIRALEKQALLEAMQEKGVVVVRSSRVGSGSVTHTPRYDGDNLLAGDTLKPQKARLLLMLALTKTNDPQEVQRIFDEY